MLFGIFFWIFQDSDHDRLRDNMMRQPAPQRATEQPPTDLEPERGSDAAATGTDTAQGGPSACNATLSVGTRRDRSG
jgi:hypothetical protein